MRLSSVGGDHLSMSHGIDHLSLINRSISLGTKRHPPGLRFSAGISPCRANSLSVRSGIRRIGASCSTLFSSLLLLFLRGNFAILSIVSMLLKHLLKPIDVAHPKKPF